ncbi:MAG: thiamine pyrophosphate-binding protein [Leptospiraceae bacterium]|nr:thiamine pyrophosphate-binding protein [Leptospiraceae bacterium]
MKLSDYVIQFLADRGVTHFFGMSGGAAVHLFDSVAKNPNLKVVCSQHEQSASMSADGFARVTDKIGVAITTSGPGATNLLTGVCCSYYDSIPTLMLTGQVATHRLKKERKVRQIGFQETDVVSIYNSVTKYCIQIEDPKTIRYHLEKAYYIAFDGRPGPVLIDIPDDLQRVEIEPNLLEQFIPEKEINRENEIIQQIQYLFDLIKRSNRPVMVLGAGFNTPRIDCNKIESFVEAMKIPVLCTWPGQDTLSDDNEYKIGTFGVYGPRFGNFAIQNSDLIIALGTRLSQNLTGGILNSFARQSKIAMVDIDKEELTKFDGRGIQIDLKINSSLGIFLKLIQDLKQDLPNQEHSEWSKKIKGWKNKFPITNESVTPKSDDFIDAYYFIDSLSNHLKENDNIFVDTGGNVTWTSNGIKIKKNQRLISAWNNTPMGYSLPAAIGAAFAQNKTQICIIGDGGLMICLSELATVVKHNLKIKIFLFNNHSHGIQKQTLQTWLNGKYVGVDPNSGLAFPDFPKVAEAFGLKVITIKNKNDADTLIPKILSNDEPVFCNVEIFTDQKLYPVVKFGSPLEDQLPSLPAGVIESEMIIDPFRK